MSDPLFLPQGYRLRPAQFSDCWQLYRLLLCFGRPPRRPARLLWLWGVLGVFIVLGIRLLLLIGLLPFIQVGVQIVAMLAVAIGAALIATIFSFTLSHEWTNFWVVEHDTLIACAKLCQNADYAVLYDVLVAPEWRGQGVGSALVSQLAKGASRPLYLSCYPDKISFYTRLGFVQVKPQTLAPIVQHDLGLGIQKGTVPLVLF